MKTIMLTLSLVLFCGVIYPQADTTNYGATSEFVTDGDAEKLIDKYLAKTEAALESFAQTLKVPADHVYGVLIKQQKIRAYAGIIISILAAIMLIVCVQLWKNENSYVYSEYNNEDIEGITGIGVVAIVLSMFAVTLVIAAFAMGQNTITGLLNPEYGAIQEIMRVIHF